ncbi:MAG: hypothetical protein U0236_14020 [Nitrospira sp.]
MTSLLRTWPIFLILSVVTTTANAADGLTLSDVVKPGTTKYYDHHQSIVLAPGFWAQAGVDVTTTINQTPGYYLDKTPLDPSEDQFTSNESRKLIVAGCLPQNRPVTKTSPISGYTWTICNDIDFVKDKVVESEFISCLDIYRNGVMSGASVKEINYRTWQSFRFSCRDLAPSGSMTSPAIKTPFLFHFEREGTLSEADVPDVYLLYGLKEYWQGPGLAGQAFASFAFLRGPASLLDQGKKADPAHYFGQTDVIPRYPPAIPLTKLHWFEWTCPLGMTLTGAAIGHIPDNKGKDTRPVYMLAECRRLLHNP